jgi:hypothetical protein
MVVLAGIPSTGNKFVPNRKLSQHPFPRENALGGREWSSFVAMLPNPDRRSPSAFQPSRQHLPASNPRMFKQPEDVQATLMTEGCREPKLVAEQHLKVT